MDNAHGIAPEDLLTHLDWLSALARQLVLDQERAKDLVQDACLVALRKHPRDASGLRGWLAQVLRNLHRQRARSEDRARAYEQSVARLDVADATGKAVERVALQRELARHVLELEEPGRTVILLRFYTGLPPSEIADKLGVSVPVVNGRLHRALARLRDRLGSEAKWDLAAWSTLLMDPVTGAPQGALSSVTSPGAWVMAASSGVSSAVKLGVGVAVVLALGVTAWLALPTAKTAAQDAMPSATKGTQIEATPAQIDHGEQERVPVAQQAHAISASTDPGAEAKQEVDFSALGGQAPDAFLDSLAMSFLTETPDLKRLDQGMRYIAQHASIDESSVTRDEWKVEGKLVIANADIDATFAITPDEYRITLNPYPRKVLPYPFEKRDFTVLLSEKKGYPVNSAVLFWPDFKLESSGGFRLEREMITGWGAFIGQRGTNAQPMSLKIASNGRWELGPGSMPRIQDNEATDASAYAPLLKLLQPYAQ